MHRTLKWASLPRDCIPMPTWSDRRHDLIAPQLSKAISPPSVPAKCERVCFPVAEATRNNRSRPPWAGSAARTTGSALAPPSRAEEFKEVIALCGMRRGMQAVGRFMFVSVGRAGLWRERDPVCDVCAALPRGCLWPTHLESLPRRPGGLSDRSGRRRPEQLFGRCTGDVWSHRRGRLEACHLENK